MPLNPDQLLTLPPIVTRQKLAPHTAILYALGVGAEELAFVYEEDLRVLPTMAVTMAYPGLVWRDPAFGIDWQKILHAETSITCHAPLPVAGDLVGYTTFGPIIDKGAAKGAIVYQTREVHLANGTHIATVRNTTFLRGDGGQGGNATVQPSPYPIPDRVPDASHTMTTATNQALIYRLSGDLNPLHADPEAAKTAGFDRPILHGLCTFGVVGRSLLAVLADNDPARIHRIDARFSSPVYPGETIRTDIWHEGAGTAAFRASVVERDLVVLNNGYAEFS